MRPVPEEGVVVEDVCPGTGLGDALDERRKAGRGRRSDADGRKLDPVLADLLRRFHHLLAGFPRHGLDLGRIHRADMPLVGHDAGQAQVRVAITPERFCPVFTST